MKWSKANENIGTVIAGNDVQVGVNRRENAASNNVGFEETALSEQELVAIAWAVDLKNSFNVYYSIAHPRDIR